MGEEREGDLFPEVEADWNDVIRHMPGWLIQIHTEL